MPKVLISDKLSQNAVDIFAAHGVETDVKTGLSPEDLQTIVGAYDGLAVRSATKVIEAVALGEIDDALAAEVMEEIRSLPYVVRADSLLFSAQD